MASERFPLLPPDYGTSSPLKFDLRFFLKRYMTFSFIIFFSLSFLRCVCYKFPNMYSRVICKLVLNDILMSFFTL